MRLGKEETSNKDAKRGWKILEIDRVKATCIDRIVAPHHQGFNEKGEEKQ